METGPAAEVYAAPKHPYTRALLDAVPSPDPSRRRADEPKGLPAGEVPDAIEPPPGCRFHPRCPAAFAPCGWEGRDLVAAFEERWTDPEAFAAESPVVGPLSAVSASARAVSFPAGGEALATLLRRLRDERAHPVFTAVSSIDANGERVDLHLGDGAEPALQLVGATHVACHLHGIKPTSE